MPKHETEGKMGPGDYLLTGAGVGVAGAGSVVTLMGFAAGVAVLPVTLAVGVAGGLLWWAATSTSKKPKHSPGEIRPPGSSANPTALF